MAIDDETTIPSLSSSPRCKPLWAWLMKYDATCCWTQDIKSPAGTWTPARVTARIECWRVGAGLALIMINKHGWSVFTEQSDENDIERTLADAERRVGLMGLNQPVEASVRAAVRAAVTSAVDAAISGELLDEPARLALGVRTRDAVQAYLLAELPEGMIPERRFYSGSTYKIGEYVITHSDSSSRVYGPGVDRTFGGVAVHYPTLAEDYARDLATAARIARGKVGPS